MEGRREKGEDLRDKKVGQSGGGGETADFIDPGPGSEETWRCGTRSFSHVSLSL